MSGLRTGQIFVHPLSSALRTLGKDAETVPRKAEKTLWAKDVVSVCFKAWKVSVNPVVRSHQSNLVEPALRTAFGLSSNRKAAQYLPKVLGGYLLRGYRRLAGGTMPFIRRYSTSWP